MKSSRLILPALCALAAASAARAVPGHVAGSKHDLSVSGPGPVKAATETEVCIFCHVPHASGAEVLSSRPDPAALHRAYESSTMAGRAGTPDGASRICLSCHDGTIAVGSTRRKEIRMNAAAPGGRLPPGRSNLGTDLRGTHPVSFQPDSSGRTRPPPPDDAVHLDRSGKVQCTSCHDPHREDGDPAVRKFLVKPSRRSDLCLSCHEPLATRYPDSAHARSGASFGRTQGNEAGYGSVADAGCAACHASHGGDAGGRLLRGGAAGGDDAACLACHATNVTRLDLGRDMAKPWSHSVPGDGAHDAAEAPEGRGRRLPEASPAAPRHASCVDCHDPHAASDRPALAPEAGGALDGVWGIDRDGRRIDQVRFEYEVCFKCHADSMNKPQQGGSRRPDAPRRAVTDVNLRRVFDPSAPSSHPVVAAGRNPDVPSLRAPWTAASMVRCSDCHASESGPGAGGSGARGPHGSVYAALLERPYATADGTVETPSSYALCYKCHDREVLLSSRSAFPAHRAHVVDGRTPCSACHASHGVSSEAGTPDANAHLLDFDVSIVRPGPGGLRAYAARGPRSGTCTLSCHGSTHDAKGY
jgi:predicted CXXCH cytochrome family protein